VATALLQRLHTHTSVRGRRACTCAPGDLGVRRGGSRSAHARRAARLCSSSSGAPSASAPRCPLSGAAPAAPRASEPLQRSRAGP